MNRLLKSAVLATAIAATPLAALPAAQADDWGHHGGWRHHGGGGGDLLAAGVVGLALGAITAGVLTQPAPEYYEPVYREVPPRPRPERRYYVAEPQVVYADRYRSLEPWTGPWYDFCSSRYRTFDPQSGTFVGRDGREHFCAAN